MPTHLVRTCIDLHWELDYEPPHEPAGSEPVATGSVSKCATFWRSFVRSSWVMRWIDYGYSLVWVSSAPAFREFQNAPSALQHSTFVDGAVEEMLAA